MWAHQRTRTRLEGRLRERRCSGTASAFETNAPGIVAVRRDLEDLGEQLGRDDAADHPEDDERVPVERQPRRLR